MHTPADWTDSVRAHSKHHEILKQRSRLIGSALVGGAALAVIALGALGLWVASASSGLDGGTTVHADDAGRGFFWPTLIVVLVAIAAAALVSINFHINRRALVKVRKH